MRALRQTSPSKAISSAASWEWLPPVSGSRLSPKWQKIVMPAAVTYASVTLEPHGLSWQPFYAGAASTGFNELFCRGSKRGPDGLAHGKLKLRKLFQGYYATAVG